MLGKKIPTLIGLILLILVGAGLWLWQRSGRESVAESIVPTRVTITNIADNKFSVSWVTAEPTIGSVEYGKVGDKLDKSSTDDRGMTFVGRTHHVTLTELQPSTSYAFRILSGEGKQRFDNNGSVYTVTTGQTIAEVPAARSLYGDVSGGNEDTIVYVSLPNGQSASVTLTSTASYSIPLSTIRSEDLSQYVSYDPAATIVALTVESGNKSSKVNVSTTNITPVPTIALGQDADYRTPAAPVQVAQVEPVVNEPVVSPEPTPAPVGIFNVEPLEGAGVNQVTSGATTLQNPAVEGEVLSTTKPEFRGTGIANSTITASITGQKTVSDTIRVNSGGTWSWTPAITLAVGKQKITLSYTDKDGKAQKIERSFSITNSTSVSEPAFVATPSASLASTPTPTPSQVPSPSPRVAIPATDSGVPVTGVMTPTLLTGALGFAIMLVGAMLLAL